MVVCFCVYFARPHIAEKHRCIRLTSSTSSAHISTSTTARITVHLVSAGASMLTRAADTFGDVWKENKKSCNYNCL